MKTFIKNYTFDKVAKTVTFIDYTTIRLDNILLITNVTSNKIIYNFAAAGVGGTVLTNVLTLQYDTSTMANTDKLIIAYENGLDAAYESTSGELYFSPIDFQATYASSSTITITGSAFDIDDTNCLVTKIYYKPISGIWTTLVNTNNGVSITASSNVITVVGAGTPFVSTDIYIVFILGQRKGYDLNTDTIKTTEQAPITNRYVQDSLVDTINTSATTTYFPATTGQAMDGYKDLSLSGKFITTGTLTMTIEASNDEDTTNADWIQMYGFDTKNNLVVNTFSVTNATLTFAIDFDNFNYSNYRIKVVDSSSTNTYIVKARKKGI